MNTKISFFDNHFKKEPVQSVRLDAFLDNIKDGQWQDSVIKYRHTKDTNIKKSLPAVTLSGVFSTRKDDCITEYSNILGIDIDKIGDSMQELRQKLSQDPYVYAFFSSCGGDGLCVLFKIDGKKHRESFNGLGAYFLQNYQVIIDPSCVNVSRLRYVSYDPSLFINQKSEKFKLIEKKRKELSYTKVIFRQTDFDDIVKQVYNRGINLCDSYEDWLRVGFALSDKFGEDGRDYFHIFSSQSHKYNIGTCNKQYDKCLRARGSKKITISTLYHLCKEAGIEIYSRETKEAIKLVKMNKDSGMDNDAIALNLKKNANIEPELSANIAEQLDHGAIVNKKDIEANIIDDLELFLKQSYSFKRNNITRFIEQNGIPMDTTHFNSVYIKAKRVLPKINYELVYKLIDSEYTPNYNPLMDWINENKNYPTTGTEIQDLADSLKQTDRDFTKHLLKKWFIGIIASVHGQHSPLMLCLTGEKQGTGKTEWFRQLLPTELKKYYAESKLDEGKDSEILMCQKLLIIDDEMGGKSKADEKRLKELLSKQVFSLREPYGRANIDLLRLAVLGGTSNENTVLNDPTGNRRLIPFEIKSLNHEIYNSIDKKALFIDMYKAYSDGASYQLSKEDIEKLSGTTENHRKRSLELELIQKYYETAGENDLCMYMTCSDIKIEIEEKTKQKLSLDKLGKELSFLGFIKEIKRVNGKLGQYYLVNKTEY